MQGELYVHVPFCSKKCRYCAFYSESGVESPLIAEYPRLVRREVRLRAAPFFQPSTIYIGGGTPSLLGPLGLRSLFDGFRDLNLCGADAEITVELNPGDVTPALVSALEECGVTRASLGVQSFSDETLAWLGRRHGAARARAAFSLLRGSRIPAVSIDIITAIPGEPDDTRLASLREAAAVGADHVSVYPLSVERGTPLHGSGVRPVSDDASLAAAADAQRILEAAGYARYEISNYARPGFGCRHNLAVWNGGDYLGVGPGAHSRTGFERRANACDFAAYAEALRRGVLPPAETAVLDPEDDENERFLTRVRLARWRGPDVSTPRGRARMNRISALMKTGIVRPAGDNEFSLTPRGFEVADAVMSELNV